MEKMYKIIIVIFLCFLSSMANAQENNADMISISETRYLELLKDASDLKISRDSTKQYVDSCAFYNKQIEVLRADSIKSKSDILEKESLIKSLKEQHSADSLASKEINSKLSEMQASMDETSAKYANGRLYFKFDAKRINDCLADYEQLKTQSVKETFKQLPDLLRNYGSFSEQLKSLLLSAQNDPDRKVRNKAEEYKLKYTNEIRSSFYYTNYYAKKDSGTWSIPYLNNIIEVALSILQKHDPGHNDPVNFNSLIEML